MDLLWLTHPECGRHEMGAGHPEQPARLAAVEAAVTASAIGMRRLCRQAGPATPSELERVHDGRSVDAILKSVPTHGYVRLDADTVMNPHSGAAALRAAGACVEAVQGAMADEFRLAFCAVRPPGHHAERNTPMGFCLFDNIAVGAAEALALGAGRVAILDFDVHYGNGSVDIFRDDERVLVCNTYQYPLYPYWANGGGGPNIADAPLAPGAGGAEFREAVQSVWLPALAQHQPELILVSAGFDAHRDDPLANLEFIEADYRWIGAVIREQAERHSGGRVVAALEGGYALDALGSSVVAFLGGLLDSGAAHGARLNGSSG